MRAALYLRVSTEEQAREGLSLQAQKEALIAFCKSQNYTLGDIYMDDGYSGKDVNRPAVQRMIRDIKAGKIDVVLVYKLDRLSRSQKDVLLLLEDTFEKSNVGFRSVTEPFDTTTPFGKAIIGMLAVFAQLERETIVQRMDMGKEQAAKEGRWHGGDRVTFGYQYDPNDPDSPNHIVVDPVQAETVRLIFELYTKNQMGYESIARYLNGENPEGRVYETARGAKQWRFAAVRYVLRNPTYVGYVKHKGQLFEGKHQPLVDRETFELAQRLSKERFESQPAKKASLLSGLVRCAECGGRMRSKRQWVNWPRKPKKYHHNYVCYNYLGSPLHLVTGKCTAAYRHGPRVEENFLKEFSRFMFEEERIDQAIEQYYLSSASNREVYIEELTARKRQAKEVRQKLERWYLAFEDGGIDLETVKERIAQLQDEEANIRDRITELEAKLSKPDETRLAVQELKRSLKDFGPALAHATHDELWTIIHHTIEEVWLDRDGNIVDIKPALPKSK